jgi:hypothetical protein
VEMATAMTSEMFSESCYISVSVMGDGDDGDGNVTLQ